MKKLGDILFYALVIVFFLGMALVFWNGVIYHINLGS